MASWYDYIPSLPFQIGNAATGGDPFGAGKWLNKRPNQVQMPANPYQGQWDALLGQLSETAAGRGPSLAGDAYKQAHAQGMNDTLAMSRGGSAGAAHAGMQQMGRANQGFAQGYANARLQEQLAARQQLTGALQGAGQAWWQPQYTNLLSQMGTPTNMQTLLQLLQQGGAVGGSILKGGGGM